MRGTCFSTIQDRRGRVILSIRDQNTVAESLRRKRLMTLLHVFLIHRYRAAALHYLTSTQDNQRQCESLQRLRIFDRTYDEVGEIIVADVNPTTIADLVQTSCNALDVFVGSAH